MKATLYKTTGVVAGDPRGWHPVWAWECPDGEDAEYHGAIHDWNCKNTYVEARADLYEHFREEHR